MVYNGNILKIIKMENILVYLMKTECLFVMNTILLINVLNVNGTKMMMKKNFTVL